MFGDIIDLASNARLRQYMQGFQLQLDPATGSWMITKVVIVVLQPQAALAGGGGGGGGGGGVVANIPQDAD